MTQARREKLDESMRGYRREINVHGNNYHVQWDVTSSDKGTFLNAHVYEEDRTSSIGTFNIRIRHEAERIPDKDYYRLLAQVESRLEGMVSKPVTRDRWSIEEELNYHLGKLPMVIKENGNTYNVTYKVQKESPATDPYMRNTQIGLLATDKTGKRVDSNLVFSTDKTERSSLRPMVRDLFDNLLSRVKKTNIMKFEL